MHGSLSLVRTIWTFQIKLLEDLSLILKINAQNSSQTESYKNVYKSIQLFKLRLSQSKAEKSNIYKREMLGGNCQNAINLLATPAGSLLRLYLTFLICSETILNVNMKYQSTSVAYVPVKPPLSSNSPRLPHEPSYPLILWTV